MLLIAHPIYLCLAMIVYYVTWELDDVAGGTSEA